MDVAYAMGLREEYGDRRLEVGRQSGIRQRLDRDRAQFAGSRAHPEGLVLSGDIDAHLPQFEDERGEVLKACAFDLDFAVSDGAGDREGARFQAIGDDLVVGAVKATSALHCDGVAARTRDPGAHALQHSRGALHFRLGGGVDDPGRALRRNSSEYEVLRAEDAGVVAKHRGALQAVRAGQVFLSVARNVRAESGKAGQVHVYGALADDVAARGRAGGLAQAAQERAHDEEASAQVAHDVGWGSAAGQPGGIDAQDVWRLPVDCGSEAAEDAGHLLDIADVRHVADGAVFSDEERSGHGAHGGVLGAVDADVAVEGMPAFDNELAPGFQGHNRPWLSALYARRPRTHSGTAAPALGCLETDEGALQLGRGLYDLDLGDLLFEGALRPAAGFFGADDVDVLRTLGGVGQDRDLVVAHFQEAAGDRHVNLLAGLDQAHDAALDHGQERRVHGEHSQLALGAGGGDLIDPLFGEDEPFSGYDIDFQRHDVCFRCVNAAAEPRLRRGGFFLHLLGLLGSLFDCTDHVDRKSTRLNSS